MEIDGAAASAAAGGPLCARVNCAGIGSAARVVRRRLDGGLRMAPR